MRRSKVKDKCTKIKLKKSKEVVKTFDNIQLAYARMLDNNDKIKSIQCNVRLEDITEGDFSSDFLCLKTDGEYMVRECVYKKNLSFPRTCKLLDISREYWLRRGITDWGIVIEKENKLYEGE